MKMGVCMDAVQIVFLVLLWGVPIVRFIQMYRKMNEEEQAEIKTSIKTLYITWTMDLDILVLL
jgi:hypothetical protein